MTKNQSANLSYTPFIEEEDPALCDLANKNQNNTIITRSTITAEMAGLGVMSVLSSYFRSAWAELIGAVLYPYLFIFNALETIYAWREVHLEKTTINSIRNKTLIKALIYTTSTLALCLASVSLLVSFASALLAPLLLFSTYALKTFYHFSSAIYYAYRSATAGYHDGNLKYREKAITNLYLGIAGLIVTAAFGFILLANKAVFGVLGLIGGAAASAVSTVVAYKKYKEKTEKINLEGKKEIIEQQTESQPLHHQIDLIQTPVNQSNSTSPSTLEINLVLNRYSPNIPKTPTQQATNTNTQESLSPLPLATSSTNLSPKSKNVDVTPSSPSSPSNEYSLSTQLSPNPNQSHFGSFIFS